MRKLFACLGAVTLLFVLSSRADAQAVLKPYVTLILDTSGSMVNVGSGNPTGSGPPSCGGIDNKLNHAKCAIRNIANSYGDIEFAFGRFRNIMSGTTTAATFPAGCSSPGPDNTGGVVCTNNDDMFELLNPLVDNNNNATAVWVDGTGNTCTNVGTDPEIWNADSNTPLEGALKGVKRYWQGSQATPTTLANSPTGATEAGTTATFTATANHHIVVGEPVVVAGVGVAGYNGRFIVATVPSATTFTVTGMPAGLAASGGGTVAVEIFSGSAAQGFAPIANDPTKNVFLPALCDPKPTCVTHSPAQTGDCCTTQCRPYVTILLTDGDETCGGNPANGAAAMLKTLVGPNNYRIETRPIGFGITPPATNACAVAGAAGCQIEDIAHAGGAPDVAGKLEGFYAADAAGVELAVSKIIEGSVRTELCNNLDDDCDTLIDEDFPNKGASCNNGLQGICAVSGALACRADGASLSCDAGTAACAAKLDGAACVVKNTANANVPGTCTLGACVPTIGSEGTVCNGLDDDCDGVIDEGISGCQCIPQQEICNGKDDDCDGKVDEDTDVPCGVNLGVCTTGVQHCVCVGPNCGLGACTGKQPCNGVVPCVETCNNLDDDCDGIKDGLTRDCSNLPPNGHPAGDPANNPGDPGSGTPCDLEGPALCACHPGIQQCPSTGNGTFGACGGEVVPTTDNCDGIDNDCDGTVDEGFVSASCGACGVTTCVNGVVSCTQGSGTAEICDNKDNDCDGNIDEDVPDGGPCGVGLPDNDPTVCNGVRKCLGGSFQCVGAPVGVESCDCLDNDCDGVVDNNNGNCPSGSTCTKTGATCECDFACSNSEFPCPAGKVCDTTSNLCVTDFCFGVHCGADAMGNAQVCQPSDGTCVNACSKANCVAPNVCIPTTGMCAPNNCITFPDLCMANERCINGLCESNPCAGVTCPTDQYCESGNCIDSCAGVTCPTGKRCRLGVCEADPCGMPCPDGKVCHTTTNTCEDDSCKFQDCPQGQYCNQDDGMCETDPCVGTKCPSPDQVCVGGTCFDPSQFLPDAGMQVHVTAGGGGGCDTTGGNGGLVLVLGALGLALGRSRSRRRGAAPVRTRKVGSGGAA